MKNIVLFASGGGSNAEQIMQYFKGNSIKVVALFTNNATAGAIDKALSHNVSVVVFTREQLNDGTVLKRLREFNADLIVLAGFLLKFPSDIIAAYPDKVINIHPALLPKYGGKGMYGINVHKAVLENKEEESGITIHYVNDNYDEGNIIFQQSVTLEGCATAEDIAQKVLELEHRHFPEVIDQLLSKDF